MNNLMEVSKIVGPRGEKNLVFVEQTKSSPSSSAGKGTRWGVNNVFSVRSLVGSGNKAAIVKKMYDAFMWRAVSNILSNAVGFQTCGQWPSEPDISKNDCVFPDLDTCAPVTTLLGTSTWELMPGKQTHLKTLIKFKKQIKNIEAWPQRCQVTSQNRNFDSFVNQPPSLSCPGGVCVRQWKIAIRLSLRAKRFGLTQEKSRFFFPSLLPHQFVTFNLYIARKVAAEVSKLLWSTKKNIHSEQFLIFTFLRPYNTVGSAYEEG